MPRFVPIVIQVQGAQQGVAEAKELSNAFDQVDKSAQKTGSGLGAAAQSASQAAAETKGLSNAFSQLDQVANQAASGGMRNAFAESGLLRGEIRALTSQIPVVGQMFRYSGNDILTWARNLDGAGGAAQKFQQSQLKSIYSTFQGALSQAFRGKNDDVALLFSHIGIDVEKGVTQPLPALKTFLTEFSKIPDAEDRAAFAANVFGSQTAKLLPTLEGLAAGETAAATASTGMGAGLLGVLGPIALVVAAVVALTAGVALGGKALIDLTLLAEHTGAEVYDLSQKVNFSAETISAIKFGGIKAGIEDVKSLSASLGIFDKNIALANESDTKLAKQFKDFHVDISNNEVALRSLFQALSALPPGEKQTELAMLAFGKSGRDMLGVLKAMGGDIDGTIAKLEQMGLIMSTKDAKAAAEFRDKLAVLQLQIEMIGVKIGQQLMPYVERVIDAFSRLATENGPGIQKWAHDSIESAKNVGEALRDLSSVMSLVMTGSGQGVSDTSGALFMGRILSWANGAGVVVEALRQIWNLLDHIGAAIRDVPKQPAATGLSGADAKNIKQQFIDNFDETAARNLAKAGDFSKLPFSQQEEINKLLGPSTQRLEESRLEIASFGETTKFAAAQQKLLHDRILEVPPALDYLKSVLQDKKSSNDQEYLANEKQIDQMKADKKAADEAAKARETLTQRIDEANLRTQELNDTGSKSLTHTQELNAWLLKQSDSFKNQKDLIDQLTKATQNWDAAETKVANAEKLKKAAEAQEKLANAIEAVRNSVAGMEASALPEKEQRLLEAHANLNRVKNEIVSLPGVKIDRATLDKFSGQLTTPGIAIEGQEGAFAAFRSLLTPETLASLSALNINSSEFVSWLVRADKADRDLAAAQTPLGQLTKEYNDLLQEQTDLSNPLIQSKTIENQLIRDKISLEQRDLDAVIASNRAQLELSDATTYHAAQANAKVLEFLASQKSITQTVADAKVGVIQTTFDLIDRGLDRFTSKMGVLGGLVKQILSDFIRLALTPFFSKLFGVGGATGGGAQNTGGGIGSILGNFFGGGSATNGGSFSPGSSGGLLGTQGLAAALQSTIASSSNSFFAGSGITAPASLTSQLSSQASIAAAASQGGWGSIQNAAIGAAHTSLGGGGLFSGLGSSLGAMAPLLGLALGAQVGGSSLLGNIVGGAGGLLAGGIVGALTGTGIFATGGIAAAGGSLSFLPALLTNPITIALAPLLIFGAWKLGQLAQRRKDETARASAINDSIAQLQELLSGVQHNRTDGASAIASALQIRAQYVTTVTALKDTKTRNIALQDVSRIDGLIGQIKGAAADQAKHQAIAARIVPEFSTGAEFRSDYFVPAAARGLMSIPGAFDRKDDMLMRVSRGEHVAVMTPDQYNAIGGRYAFQAAGVPALATGGLWSASPALPAYTPPALNFGAPPQFTGTASLGRRPVADDNSPIELTIAVGWDGEKIVGKALKKPSNRKIIVNIVDQANINRE